MKKLFYIFAILILFVSLCESQIPYMPHAPVWVYPTNGQTGRSVNITVRWRFQDTISNGYSLQVSTDTGYANLIMNRSAITDTQITLIGLTNLRYYYCRLKAVNGDSSSTWSTRYFRTVAGTNSPTGTNMWMKYKIGTSPWIDGTPPYIDLPIIPPTTYGNPQAGYYRFYGSGYKDSTGNMITIGIPPDLSNYVTYTDFYNITGNNIVNHSIGWDDLDTLILIPVQANPNYIPKFGSDSGLAPSMFTEQALSDSLDSLRVRLVRERTLSEGVSGTFINPTLTIQGGAVKQAENGTAGSGSGNVTSGIDQFGATALKDTIPLLGGHSFDTYVAIMADNAIVIGVTADSNRVIFTRASTNGGAEWYHWFRNIGTQAPVTGLDATALHDSLLLTFVPPVNSAAGTIITLDSLIVVYNDTGYVANINSAAYKRFKAKTALKDTIPASLLTASHKYWLQVFPYTTKDEGGTNVAGMRDTCSTGTITGEQSDLINADSVAAWKLIGQFEARFISGLSEGNAVLTWIDSSGGGHTLDTTSKVGTGIGGAPPLRYNGATPKYHANATNGRAAVEFSDSSGMMNAAIGDSMWGAHKTFTVIAVIKWRDTSTTQTYAKTAFAWSGLNGSTGHMLGGLYVSPAPVKALNSYGWGNSVPYFDVYMRYPAGATPIYGVDTFRVCSWAWNGSDTMVYRKDGVELARVFAGDTLNTLSVSNFTIGRRYLAGDEAAIDPSRMTLASMYIYNSYLPSIDPAAFIYLEGALKRVYGTPYYYVP